MNAQPSHASHTPPAPAENALPVGVADLFAKVDRLIKAAATRQLSKDPLFELTPEALAKPVEGLALRFYVQRRELVDGFELRLRKALKGRGLTGQSFLAGQLAKCWASLAEAGYNVDFIYWLDQAYGIRIALLESDISEASRREQQDIARERETRRLAQPKSTPIRQAARDIVGIEAPPQSSNRDSSSTHHPASRPNALKPPPASDN